MASRLLFLSMFGWCVGVVPAIIDGTIAVNQVMHNTLWVPGHFHMYLILGLVAMLFGFMYYFSNQAGEKRVLDRIAFWLYLGAGFLFSFGFLTGGYNSVPRRWAAYIGVQMEEWVGFSQTSSIFGAIVAVAALVFALRFLTSLKHARTA